jgi:hypothetical protein
MREARPFGSRLLFVGARGGLQIHSCSQQRQKWDWARANTAVDSGGADQIVLYPMLRPRLEELITSETLRKTLGIIAAIGALICAAIAVHAAWRWPLTGDEGIFHAIVSMLENGSKPYSEIKDINFPGAYFLDASAMRILGGQGTGERAYDLVLCVIAAAGFFIGVGKGIWAMVGAFVAGSMFVLIHLQDGLAQGGQRDFAMAAFAVVACAIYLREKKKGFAALIVYQLLVGFILVIKPTLALLFLVPLIVPPPAKRVSQHLSKVIGVSLGCVAIAPFLAWMWLLRQHASSAFISNLRTIGALHASLPRRDLSYLCLHAGAPVAVFTVIWLALLLANHKSSAEDHAILMLAVLAGLVSYLAQGKGLPYQRYPFLGLMLLALFAEIETFRARSTSREWLAVLAYAVFGLWLSPTMLRKVQSFQAVAPFETALAADLTSVYGGSPTSVQCVDTFSGCLMTLYDIGTVQSNAYLYDCYLFNGTGTKQDQYRKDYLKALVRKLPRLIVVTDQNCFVPDPGFQRLTQWKEFSDLLSRHYQLATVSTSEQTFLLWNRRERRVGFEIYELR